MVTGTTAGSVVVVAAVVGVVVGGAVVVVVSAASVEHAATTRANPMERVARRFIDASLARAATPPWARCVTHCGTGLGSGGCQGPPTRRAPGRLEGDPDRVA